MRGARWWWGRIRRSWVPVPEPVDGDDVVGYRRRVVRYRAAYA